MHHIPFQPRSLPGTLLFACLFFIGSGAARAQMADTASVLVVPVNQTRTVEMSSKNPIMEVRTDNPKVASVKTLLGDPNRVMVTGLNAGATLVSLTDNQKKTETFEVRVPADDEVVRAENRKKLIELIRQSVPTAVVDVVASPNNTVVLTGTVDNVEHVNTLTEMAKSFFGVSANVVNALRIGGVHQVQVQVVVARVNRSEFRNLGFSFVAQGNRFFVTSTTGGAGAFASNLATGAAASAASLSSTPNAVVGILNDNSSFTGYLSALRTEGIAKLNSDAFATTLSGRPGNVVVGGKTPILTTSGTGAPNVTYEQFGTVVNFLPIVLGNGKIHLEVKAIVSNLDAAAGISISSATGVTSVPGFAVRSAEASMQMEDGQTLAIGGLIQNAINGTTSKIPVLGDLPFIGAAFSTKSYTESEEELLILVTPRLVDPMACTQLPRHLPGQETRSPDDFELFLEGILEAPRGQRTPCPAGCGSYTAAHKTGPTAGAYPCGDATQPCHRRGSLHGGRCATGSCGPTCGPSGCYPALTGSDSNMHHGSSPRATSGHVLVSPSGVDPMPPTLGSGAKMPSTTVAPARIGRLAVPAELPAASGGDMILAPIVPPASIGPAADDDR